MSILKKLFGSKSAVTPINITSEPKEILPPITDPHIMPTCVDDFKECHIKVLRRLNKHPEKEMFSGLMALEVDIPKFIPVLQKLHLIEWASYNESLSFMKNDTLKDILRNFNLKISGTKKELVNRIIENIDESSVRALDLYSDHYILTGEGRKIIDASYSKFETEKLSFFETAINLIMQKQLEQAYRMICKRNAELPAPPGINCDWKMQYHNGIPQEQKEIFDLRITTSTDTLLTAAAIYSHMSGDSLKDVRYYLRHVFHIEANIVDSLHDEYFIISEDRHFRSYSYAGIEKYRFLATLDTNTCPICGNLDGKVFNLSERKIGVNYPPMHNGCRCTVVAFFSDISNEKNNL